MIDSALPKAQSAERPHKHTAPQRDAGATFVEMLVAVVLLGTVVVATLAGLQATITGSRVDRDQSRAIALLQAASDRVAATAYIACVPTPSNNAAIRTQYQSAANNAPKPQGWASITVQVVSVQYLTRNSTTGVEAWSSTTPTTADCQSTLSGGSSSTAGIAIYPQLVTLRVASPDGTLLKTLELIKSV